VHDRGCSYSVRPTLHSLSLLHQVGVGEAPAFSIFLLGKDGACIIGYHAADSGSRIATSPHNLDSQQTNERNNQASSCTLDVKGSCLSSLTPLRILKNSVASV
jgi:hypothetical protein